MNNTTPSKKIQSQTNWSTRPETKMAAADREVLAELIKMNLDSSTVLKNASMNVEHGPVALCLKSHANALVEHVTQLQAALIDREIAPPVEGSSGIGALWREWMDVRSFMGSDNITGVLKLAQEAEQGLLESYIEAQGKNKLKIWTSALLTHHQERLRQALKTLGVMSQEIENQNISE